MTEPPELACRVALTGLDVAGLFADKECAEHFCSSTTFSDFTQRPFRRLGLCWAACRSPGYQPNLATEMARCRNASRRPIMARDGRCGIYVRPMTDGSAATPLHTLTRLTVLSRAGLTEIEFLFRPSALRRPRVILDPRVVVQSHYDVAPH